MFDRLHPKMRGIGGEGQCYIGASLSAGELELVKPSIEIYMKLLQMPSDKMTDVKHAEIGGLARDGC